MEYFANTLIAQYSNVRIHTHSARTYKYKIFTNNVIFLFLLFHFIADFIEMHSSTLKFVGGTDAPDAILAKLLVTLCDFLIFT